MSTAAIRTVIIIGAGPAGLAAAEAAVEAGARVTLVDSAPAAGGQYWRHLPGQRVAAAEDLLHHGWGLFADLREAVAPARQLMDAQVWAIEREKGVPVVHLAVGQADGSGRRMISLRSDALVLATGAYDRALPVPGWTLPGVYTAGAAQAMAKGERIALGRRVVVSGAGPFLFPVTRSIAQAGARVVGVYEAAGLRQLARGWGARPWQLLGAPHKLAEMAGYAGHQLGGRVPYLPGRQVIAIHPDQSGRRVGSVTVARLSDQWVPVPGSEQTVECDTVCLGHGFVPRLELPIAAGCELDAAGFVRVDEAQLSSVAGVYAAGEITTIGGVDFALATGRIAGWIAAGRGLEEPELDTARRDRRRYAAFAGRIGTAHGIRPGWTSWLTPQTVICRCEDVRHEAFTQVLDGTRASGLRSLKLTSRAGLGLCQGRVCGRTVTELLTAHRGGRPPADGVSIDRRPIAAPITLAELARADQP